jgi:CotS family spore coat protein
MLLYDYGLGTLEQYGLTPEKTFRTRGALLCQSEEGLLILREFHGSQKKLMLQQELQKVLKEKGFCVDDALPNLEGSLVSRDKDGIFYTLSHWPKGRECDTRSREDITRSVTHLARLHKEMHLTFLPEYQQRSLKEEYLRHNRELSKIRRFIRGKGASHVFEKEYLSSVETFLKRGEEALARLEDSAYEELRLEAARQGCVCHGEYHQHNVWFEGENAAVVNFGRWNFDIQMADLYRFLRKIMEKYNWDASLARYLLGAYHQEKPISPEEFENLKIRFIYPDKYWKLADYYYTHNKAWISEKQVEKLRCVIRQEKLWEEFSESCFGSYPF